jgi:hypothetical protein
MSAGLKFLGWAEAGKATAHNRPDRARQRFADKADT